MDDCTKPARQRGLCSMHYGRYIRHGDPNFVTTYPTICTVDGCDAPFSAKGYCRMHYIRWQRHGDPTHREFTEDVEARFLEKTKRLKSGCLVWTAYRDSQGRGKFGVGRNKVYLAHIWAYEHWVGPVPEGKELDHECHNRALRCPGGACIHRSCVEVTHLVPKSHRDNLNASHRTNAAKTHCPYGHEYNEENTGYPKSGGRICRQCRREKERERRNRIRQSSRSTRR